LVGDTLMYYLFVNTTLTSNLIKAYRTLIDKQERREDLNTEEAEEMAYLYSRDNPNGMAWVTVEKVED